MWQRREKKEQNYFYAKTNLFILNVNSYLKQINKLHIRVIKMNYCGKKVRNSMYQLKLSVIMCQWEYFMGAQILPVNSTYCYSTERQKEANCNSSES